MRVSLWQARASRTGWLGVRPRPARFRGLACAFGACLLGPLIAGCAGPKPASVSLEQPIFSAPEAFRLAQPAASSAIGGVHTLDRTWGQIFDDPLLDPLLAAMRRQNASLLRMRAETDLAISKWKRSRAERRPLVDGALSAGRSAGPLVNEAGATGNLFRMAFNLQVPLDPFESLSKAQTIVQLEAHGAQAAERAVELRLDAEVIRAHLEAKLAQAEWVLANRACHVGRELVGAAQGRVQAGLSVAAFVEQEVTQLQRDEQDRQHALSRRAQAEHALSELLADPSYRWPGRGVTALGSDADVRTLGLVPEVPAGLPAEMLARRADVAQAGLRVQAAQGRLEITRDSWFPAITLTANAGLASADLVRWVRAAAVGGALGLLVQIPDLLGERRAADVEATQAVLATEVAGYRLRVLAALREVEDQLARQQQRRHDHVGAAQALAAAESASRRATAMREAGLGSSVDVLRKQREVLRLVRALLHAETQSRLSAVELLHALGGPLSTAGDVQVRGRVF